MKFTGETGEYFELQLIDDINVEQLKETEVDTLRLLWFTSDHNELVIDGIPYQFNNSEIIFLTQFHKLEFKHVNKLKLLRFNRPFYCILENDSEVGCKGILYFGAAELPIISLVGMEQEVMETAWRMATLEFEMRDNLQLEMLQMMLKRILILCTRIYKSQPDMGKLDHAQNNIVREFNYLVESNFKNIHNVGGYADLLFKSPKTITNAFKKLGEKTPLQFIHDRIMLEARRLLWYSDRDISQIAYSTGFNDVQSFSRFFRNNQGKSPSDYRLQSRQGKN